MYVWYVCKESSAGFSLVFVCMRCEVLLVFDFNGSSSTMLLASLLIRLSKLLKYHASSENLTCKWRPLNNYNTVKTRWTHSQCYVHLKTIVVSFFSVVIVVVVGLEHLNRETNATMSTLLCFFLITFSLI